MLRLFSLMVVWSCLAALILVPAALLYLLFDLSTFARVTQNSLALPIQWLSVNSIQWYGLWAVTVLYVATGLSGVFFLLRAFSQFAKGEFFNVVNSRNLRLFSIFLFVNALATPIHFALSSLLLSFNHPAGQKMLSISFGSGELHQLILAMILWVISELLLKSAELENENKQFI